MTSGASRGTPAVALRAAQPDDQAFLLEVYASTRADELALVDWDNARKNAFVRMQFDAQRRDYTRRFAAASFDVVVVDGEPAGRLYVDRSATDEINIIDVALLPEFRGRGIGTALVRQVQDEAAAAGTPVRMYVERFNRALRLYERLGFTLARDEGVYLLLEWKPQVNTAS